MPSYTLKCLLLITSTAHWAQAVNYSIIQDFTNNFEEFHHRTRRQTGGFMPTCKDAFQNCVQNKNFCTMEAYAEKFKTMCKVTCGVCDPEAEKMGSVGGATTTTEANEAGDDSGMNGSDIRMNGSDGTSSSMGGPDSTGEGNSGNSTTSASSDSTSDEDPNACRDLLADCSVIKALCSSGAGNSHYHCRKSCGLCDQEVERTTTVSPLFTTPGTALVNNGGASGSSSAEDPNCVDKMDKCKLWVPLCTQPDELKRKAFVFQCKKTCGLCDFNSNKDLNKPTLPPIQFNTTDTSGAPKVIKDCKDNYPGCRSTTTLMCTTSEAVRANCPLRCGVCHKPVGTKDEDFSEEKCKDMSSTVCGTMKQFCKDPGYTKNLQMMCPITCQMDCFSKKDLEDAIGKPNVVSVVPQKPTYQRPFSSQGGMNMGGGSAPTVSAPKECKDYNSNCAFMSVMCTSRPKIQEMCPVTCNKCGDNQPPATTPAPSEKVGECKDLMPGCNNMKSFCQTATYKKQMAENCAKTCGICGTPAEPAVKPEEPKVPCKDFNSQCTSDIYKNNCHMSGIQKICRLSCNQCSPDDDKPATTKAPALESCKDEPTCKLISSTIYCERAITQKNCPVLCNTCQSVPVGGSEAPVYTQAAGAPVYTPVTQPSGSNGGSNVPTNPYQPPYPTQPYIPATPSTPAQVITPEPVSNPVSTDSVTIPKTIPNPNCKDTTTNCPSDWCTAPGPKKVAHVRARCKKTCNFCKATIPNPAYGQSMAGGMTPSSGGSTNSAGNSSADTCSDKSTGLGCPKEFCNMPGPKKVAHVKTNCRKTCGFCQSSSTSSSSTSSGSAPESASSAGGAAPPPCVDQKPNYCQNYMKNKCNIPSFKQQLKITCPKTCNLCPTASSSSSQESAQISNNVTPSAPACKDKLPAKCRTFKPKCNHPSYKNYMKTNCRDSCGYCASTSGSAPPSKTSPPPSKSNCADKLGKCAKMPKTYCTQGRTKAYMATNCKARCGLCPASGGAPISAKTSAAPAAGTCKDLKPKYCSSLGANRCNLGKYKMGMKQYCKATCGFC